MLLYQTEKWITKDEQEVKLEDMSQRHAINLLAFLDVRAERLQIMYLLANLEMVSKWFSGDPASGDSWAEDAALHQIDNEFEAEPDEWLRNTPLYKTIANRPDVVWPLP